MLARIVVISYVASAFMTSGRTVITSSSVIVTLVCSEPRNMAVLSAYFESIGSLSMPIENVLIGFPSILEAIEHTRELSRPPDSRKATGVSESRRFSTAFMSFSLMFFVISSVFP